MIRRAAVGERCRCVRSDPRTLGDVSHIGTLNEKPLHASLKQWCALPGDRFEVPVDGYVIDVVRDELLIEVQTGGFSSMKVKAGALLDGDHRLRIVHPVALDRWIVRVEDDGTIVSRRRSPKHGAVVDVFAELVSFPGLLVHPRFEVEVVLTIEEEYRRHIPGKAWRRKGWVVFERRLVEVVDAVLLRDVDDLMALLPDDLPIPFTTAELSAGLGCPRRSAQQFAYCLREAGLIDLVGKQGNALEYSPTF